MRIGRTKAATNKTRVVVHTPDGAFAQSVQDTFAVSHQIELTVVPGALGPAGELDIGDATVAVVDIDAASDAEMQALQALGCHDQRPAADHRRHARCSTRRWRAACCRCGSRISWPSRSRRVELVRACAQVANGPSGGESAEAQVFSFLPAVGGAGVTTLAIQTAMLLLQSTPRGQSSDLPGRSRFSARAPAPIISTSSRGSISGEIEPRPERLDRQLLEVMLSHHASGLR